MPKVTVVIPAHDQAQYIGRAIQSVLSQTFTDFEVIVVDDGSTDNTSSVVHAFEDPRLQYVFQKNQGLSSARNTGINLGRGELLSFLDSDDEFLPNKLETLLQELSEHETAGLIAGQAIPVNERGERVGAIFDRPFPDPVELLLLGNPIHVGSVLVSREWQDKVGLFDEGLNSYEDWDMWLRLAHAGCPMLWVDRPVSLYRFHLAQMTREGDTMTRASFAVLNKFFLREGLDGRWVDLRSLAYSRAHLRAAAHDFLSGDYQQANAHLGEAVTLDSALMGNGAAALANVFLAWIGLPKFKDPLEHLDRIYRHLGDRFTILRVRRRSELGRAARQLAFDAYSSGDLKRARYAVLMALRSEPATLINRGLLSVFLRSFGSPAAS